MPPEPLEGENLEDTIATASGGKRAVAHGLRAVWGWALASKQRIALLLGGGLLLAGSAVALWIVATPGAGDGAVTLETALDALDRGDYETARRFARCLRDGRLSPDDALGAPAFVLGRAAAYEADDAWNVDKTALYLVAARYLGEARDLGFPRGRQGEGLFQLGRCLYLSGQLPACRPVLREALQANPRRKGVIHRLLAAAYLNDANPEYENALASNEVFLSEATLSPESRHEALLQRAEILLALGRTSECLDALEAIPPDALIYVDAIVMKGRVLMHEARALGARSGATDDDRVRAGEKYRAAIQTLRLAQGRDTLARQAGRKAMYLIGLCFVGLNDHRAALGQFARVVQRYVDTSEAQAADFQTAEICRRLGRSDHALAAYRRALRAVRDVDHYRNPWLPLADLRAALLKAYEHYRDEEEYETCLSLVRLLYPVFPLGRTIELTAETYRLWGQSLLARAADLPRSEAEPLKRDGRAKLRGAGTVYERLAQLRAMTEHYGDDLWDSASCYRDGRSYERVVVVLEEYLKSQSRYRHPRALLFLGEALFARGRIDEALAAFGECIEFHPRDAASFRARIEASQAHLEQGNRDEAERLLNENLNGDFLTPDSAEWRDSLFALGRLLHLAGRYDEATQRLEEAVARYPDAPDAPEARYLVAHGHRRRAAEVQEELQGDLVASLRRARAKKASEHLQAALEAYEQTRELLAARQQVAELTALENAILRNCYFAIGGIHFDLEQYGEAVRAYATAAQRYQSGPEVLEAYVQMARAHRRLLEPGESRRALEQARVVYDRLKDTEDFEQTTIYAKEQWPDLLDWLSQL